MGKISRVRTGCWTCKKRHRKCDETKPQCNNCISTNRKCEGYEQRLTFDTDRPKGLHRREQFFSANQNKTVNHGSLPRNKIKGGLKERQSFTEPSKTYMERGVTNRSAHTNNDFANNSLKSGSQDSILEITNRPENIEPETSPNDINNSGVSDETLRSPLSQAFGGLFSSGQNGESASKLPMDIALDDFLSGPMNGAFSKNDSNTNFDTELLELIGKAHVFDSGDSPANETSLVMSYQEENRMLGHFFQNLLPLLDAHPQSPWPALALRYCDFDVARSCFISLACIHIYESRKGGNEYYDKGMAHIHSTMTHLIDSISGSSPAESTISNDVGVSEKNRLQSFVILVLINVHVLFAVLEKGKSSLARYLFKVYGSICQDPELYRSWMQDESKASLVVVLSWYDTVSAMVSPDCRLPYCSPEWYGSAQNVISTSQMMGCPGEIFRALSEVCFLRHEIHDGNLRDDEHFEEVMDAVKIQIFGYRDYVGFKDGTDYSLRLKGAQCWGLAVYVSLLRLFKTDERNASIQAAVHEFIDVYSSMPSSSPIVTQMVWPVYAIGCECNSEYERASLSGFMDTLYETAKMGTLASLRWIVKEVWEKGLTQEEVLTQWLEEGVDYLPL